MTSTKNNPKLPQSTAGITSLGAVGGARGTAAGGLRIFVEFLTTYDPAAVKSLEQDMAKIDRTAREAHHNDLARNRKLSSVRQQLAHIELTRTKLVNAEARKQWKIEDSLQGARTNADKARRATAHANLEVLLRAQGLGDKEIQQIQNRHTLRKREQTIIKQVSRAQERDNERIRRRTHMEGQLTKYQQVRANIAPKLGGLAIGAVGGILGGAVLSVGWQLAENAIAAVGDKLQDLIDPARHAREAVTELGKAVNDIAADRNLNTLNAARAFVSGLGISPTSGFGSELVTLTKELAIREQIMAALQQQITLADIKTNKQKLDVELLKKAVEATREQARLEGTLTQKRIANPNYTGQYGVPSTIMQEYINNIKIEDYAKQELASITGILTDQQYNLAQATERAGQAAANSAALWNVYASSLSAAIQNAVALQTSGIDKQINALGDGTSARTKALQARMDKASSGGGGDGGARARNLANIAEERALLLLKMRLKLLGTNINLEKYTGKFLLVAINAKIAALQKEGQEQQKVNQLLDLRYRQSQTLQRNEGESISDFLARRAQENRELLSEEADIRRQNQIDALEERKDNLEDQLALEELAERKRDAMRKTSTAGHNANLAKQLAASKKADAKALAEKKAALEKQKKALEKAAADAIALTSESAQKETMAAINGMKTVEDINKFGGRMAGLVRAKNSIQALVDGFGLPKWIAQPFLDKLNGMIAAADARMSALYKNRVARPSQGHVAYASGGVFELNNAATPFGQNVRLGEEGTELGIVLSNKVAKILQQQKSPTGQVGPFIIQQSDDPFRDRSRFGRLVQSSVEAALG